MFGKVLETKLRQATWLPIGGMQNHFARQGIFFALPSMKGCSQAGLEQNSRTFLGPRAVKLSIETSFLTFFQ